LSTEDLAVVGDGQLETLHRTGSRPLEVVAMTFHPLEKPRYPDPWHGHFELVFGSEVARRAP